jgi:hypothetical protein
MASTPLPTFTPGVQPPIAVALQPTPPSNPTAVTDRPIAGSLNSVYNVWGFILLPLLGLAAGWVLWGREKMR